MLLDIKVKCPHCAVEIDWIYDTEQETAHRGSIGCPGGCTEIYDIRVNEVSEEEASNLIQKQSQVRDKLDLLESL